MVWKLNRWSGNFPDGQETFQMVWKVSSWSGKFPDSLEIFLTVWKVSGQCRKFPDCLETFQTVWKVYEQSGNLSGKYFIVCRIVATFISFVRIVLALWHVCRESDLRTFGADMSRKRFTHSVRKVFAREILPTGKF